MDKHTDFADIIDQEIDFIGQLYVEYEQMTRYEDILTAPDQIRSLASLFFDFVNRLFLLKENAEAEGITAPAVDTNNPQNLFFLSPETRTTFHPFLDFYREYPQRYPSRIDAGEVRQLYHQFPEATRLVAADLRTFSQKLRGENAG